MREFDSTKTRVVPVFNHLLELDSIGVFWLERLIRLGSRAELAEVPENLGPITNTLPSWGKKREKGLSPPLGLLEILVRNVKPETVAGVKLSEETRENRQKLADKDPKVLCEALHLLRQMPVGRPVPQEWFILEGNSRPDAFLETDTLTLVVEGKRTEASLETETTWMANRPQLIRHMDGAMAIAEGRTVLSMLLVEGESDDPMTVPAKWTFQLEQHLQPDSLVLSLPHRSERERQQIVSGVLGIATWQRVCNEFSICWPPAA